VSFGFVLFCFVLFCCYTDFEVREEVARRRLAKYAERRKSKSQIFEESKEKKKKKKKRLLSTKSLDSQTRYELKAAAETAENILLHAPEVAKHKVVSGISSVAKKITKSRTPRADRTSSKDELPPHRLRTKSQTRGEKSIVMSLDDSPKIERKPKPMKPENAAPEDSPQREEDKVAKQRLKRTNIAGEIYVTEKRYVESLVTMVKVCASSGHRHTVNYLAARSRSLTGSLTHSMRVGA
jgi:hypothetical protein